MRNLGKKIMEAGKYSISEIEHLYTVALRETFKGRFSEKFLNSCYFELDYADPVFQGQETELVIVLVFDNSAITKEYVLEQKAFISATMSEEYKAVYGARNATIRELRFMTQRILGRKEQISVCLKLQNPERSLYQTSKDEKVLLFVYREEEASVA